MNLCIIQARSGSNRLPGKSLMLINDEPMIKHVYDRCKMVWTSVVAIPEGDKPMIDALKALNIPYYEGSPDNVLERYYHCAKAYNATRIMRVTGDCPTLPLQTIFFMSQINATVVNNVENPRTYPDGWDVEIIDFAVLDLIYKNATSKDDKEHVTAWLYKNKSQLLKDNPNIKIAKVDLPINLSHLKWSIDTEDDFKIVSKLMGDK